MFLFCCFCLFHLFIRYHFGYSRVFFPTSDKRQMFLFVMSCFCLFPVFALCVFEYAYGPNITDKWTEKEILLNKRMVLHFKVIYIIIVISRPSQIHTLSIIRLWTKNRWRYESKIYNENRWGIPKKVDHCLNNGTFYSLSKWYLFVSFHDICHIFFCVCALVFIMISQFNERKFLQLLVSLRIFL